MVAGISGRDKNATKDHPHADRGHRGTPASIECRSGRAPRSKKTDDDDHRDHRVIPGDADGNPIFLILPAGVQASYDRKMKACEDGWRATGDPWAVAEAHTLTLLHRQVPPAWLDDAVWALAIQRRTKKTPNARTRQPSALCDMKLYATLTGMTDSRGTKLASAQSRLKGPQERSRRFVLHTEKAAPDLGDGLYKAPYYPPRGPQRPLYRALTPGFLFITTA